MALAEELSSRSAWCVFDIDYGDRTGLRLIQERGFSFLTSTSPSWTMPDIYIIDDPNITRDEVKTFRANCDLLVTLYPDDGPSRFYYDLVWYQGVTNRPGLLDWTGFCGEWFEGAEWVVLRKEFRDNRSWRDRDNLSIAGYGLDLEIFDDHTWGDRLIKIDNIDAVKLVDILSNRCCLAVVKYGMIVFECLALGVPVVAIPTTDEDRDSLRLLKERNPKVDGLGAVRVADKILETLEAKREQNMGK